jgi:hypothetical protein
MEPEKVKQALKLWADENPVTPKSQRVREGVAAILAVGFPEPISEISPRRVAEYENFLLEKGYNPRSVHVRLCTLRRIIHHAGVPLEENPAHAILIDKYKKDRRGEPFRNGIARQSGITLKPHSKYKPARAAESVEPQGQPQQQPQQQVKPPQFKAVAVISSEAGNQLIENSFPDFCSLWLDLGIHLQEAFKAEATNLSVWVSRCQ